MTVHFYLRFYTRPGQTLLVTGNRGNLGNNNPAEAFPLVYLNTDFWRASVELEEPVRPLQYQYILRTETGTLTFEWGSDRIVTIFPKSGDLKLIDTWNHAGEFENAFLPRRSRKCCCRKQNVCPRRVFPLP